MSGRNQLYLALDLFIGLAFFLSMGTGFAWLLSEGGHSAPTLLGIARGGWRDLHIWFSLVMIAGVVAHLALHWDWIVAMTRRLFRSRATRARWNYFLDGLLALSLAAVTATGLPFLLAGGGYHGGRNPGYRSVAILGPERGMLSDLHVWLALGLLMVVALHQMFHWAWIVRMLGNSSRRSPAELRPSEVGVRIDE
ncbi:MAG: DUF4405 domain-containing protein [Chloroflexia bacterium]